MKKQNKNNIIIIIGIIVLIVVISRVNLPTQQTFNIQTDISDINQPATSTVTNPDNSINFCGAFTENYPSYFMVKQMLCQSVGGTYLCENNKIGCYYISSWDISGCSSSQVQLLKAFCSNIEGKWKCNANEISCEK